MSKLEGIFSASVSIITEKNELDIGATVDHAKAVDKFGVQPAFLGSTSQSQLISVQEKKNLIIEISKHKFQNNILIGTGCNSLKDTVNIMSHALECNLNNFLIGNPAYYKNDDAGVYDFFKKIIKEISNAKIVIYNFNKLMNYTFSADIVKRLVGDYPDNIIGMKDSSGNCWDSLHLPNFSMFVGSETKLLVGLRKKCAGVISATTQITHFLAKKIYEDFKNNNVDEDLNDQLVKIRAAFDRTGDLVSAVHTYLSQKDTKYKRLLPPLSLLPKAKEQELLTKLKELNFISKNIAA